MNASFSVHDKQYEVSLEKKERGEGDKFNPYRAKVRGPSGEVEGTCLLTDYALEKAAELAGSGGASADELLAQACARALHSELVIRDLKPDFSFVVDHRWLE